MAREKGRFYLWRPAIHKPGASPTVSYLQWQYYEFPHFTFEDTEVQRILRNAPKIQQLNFKLQFDFIPKPMSPTCVQKFLSSTLGRRWGMEEDQVRLQF